MGGFNTLMLLTCNREVTISTLGRYFLFTGKTMRYQLQAKGCALKPDK